MAAYFSPPNYNSCIVCFWIRTKYKVKVWKWQILEDPFFVTVIIGYHTEGSNGMRGIREWVILFPWNHKLPQY